MSDTDLETLGQFVLRARRIQAHSLVQDRDTLDRLQQENVTVQLLSSGATTMTRPLPADEEVFESLAARIRPLVITSEPIYYVKVLDAIERLVHANGPSSNAHQEQLTQLRSAWTATELGQQTQTYQMWTTTREGTDAGTQVSDTELAAGWMYADLVHANPHAWKRKALDFSLQERYAAAVSVFARLAGLTVTTLDFIGELVGEANFAIDDHWWTDDVFVGTSNIVYTGIAYTAPVGTEMPDLDQSFAQSPSQWTQLTMTEYLRLDPANQVRIELADAAGAIESTYDAAVLSRTQDDGIFRWSVLLADSLIIRVNLRTEGEHTALVGLERRTVANDHRTRLRAIPVLRDLLSARQLTFRTAEEGQPRVSLDGQTPDDALGALQHEREALEDAVSIEERSGQTTMPFTRGLSPGERVRLRQARLLWEEQITQWDRTLPPAISPTGALSASWITIEPSTIPIAGSEIPMPEVHLGHPQAEWQDLGPAPEEGPTARKIAPTLPAEERFLACPTPRLPETEEDARSMTGARWELTGIDQDTFPQ